MSICRFVLSFFLSFFTIIRVLLIRAICQDMEMQIRCSHIRYFFWKSACTVWLVIIFLLFFMQQIFLECQLMPDSGFGPYMQGFSDLALPRCPWKGPHAPFNGFPCICQWDHWISAPGFLSSEPYPLLAMPYENPMKVMSLSPRIRVCICTVSIRILSVDSDKKLNSD